MTVHVLSITSSRADVGILAPVWRSILAQGMALTVFVTGMHMEQGDQPSIAGIPDGAAIRFGGASPMGTEPLACAMAMSDIQSAAAQTIETVKPDVVLVTGDRLDMFPAAAAAVPFNTPIAHLHGGEVTEGALDDRLRHAITKLAHVHLASSEDARGRILAMDEEDWRIHVTGAPGLDSLRAAPILTPETFADRTGLEDLAGLILVTVHPETNAPNPSAPAEAALDALAPRNEPILITAPNSDPGGSDIKTMIDRFVAENKNAVFRDTLGLELYANALRLASIMIGNSSSGVIEAGLFGLPVIDIGARQSGRLRGGNVTSVPNDAEAVANALASHFSAPTRHPEGTPYGDGGSGARIAAILKSVPGAENLLLKKSGYGRAA